LQHKKSCLSIVLLIVLVLTVVQSVNLPEKPSILVASALETTSPIQAYWDSNCENTVTSVDWGQLNPGAEKNYCIYIRNEGTNPMLLDLTTNNWFPTVAEQNITLSWNYDGCPVCTNEVTPVELSLHVSPKISGLMDFRFYIQLGGEEIPFSIAKVAKENILNAPDNSVYFIYSDPMLHSRPESTYDGTAGEIVRARCLNTQNYGFSTTKDWLLPTGTINTTTIHNKTVAMFGGRFANPALDYYETTKTVTPVTCEVNSGYISFKNRAGTTVGFMRLSVFDTSNYHEDMFVVMTFYDPPDQTTFFVMYGFDWKGTWASGIYFKDVISQNLGEYTQQYAVFHWADQNNVDGIPQSTEIHREG
jgi:hypothetical protein